MCAGRCFAPDSYERNAQMEQPPWCENIGLGKVIFCLRIESGFYMIIPRGVTLIYRSISRSALNLRAR